MDCISRSIHVAFGAFTKTSLNLAVQTYTIPQTELTVSRLAYGCMHLGGPWEASTITPKVKRQATEAILTALEVGITVFDHADIYSRGKSELVFGEILRERAIRRDALILQTKCGIRFKDDPPGSPQRYDFSYAHIVRSVEESLRRLGTDYIDLLLLHRPDALMEPEEVARAFDTLHRSGKVRYFGVSNHTAGQMALLMRYVDQPLVVNQLELSLLHAHLIEEGITANHDAAPAYAGVTGLLDFCRLHDVLVQAWSPLAKGSLIEPPAEADSRTLRAAEAVAELAEAKQTSREAIALAWLLRHPAPIQPIVGTLRPERIRACALADTVWLSREEWYALLTAARGERVP